MARFAGNIGYGLSVETSPGVWEVQTTERFYYGDVLKIAKRFQNSENLNDNITINDEISIVADAFAFEHFHEIQYVQWGPIKWKIDSVTVDHPRLTLSLGGIYNEQTD